MAQKIETLQFTGDTPGTSHELKIYRFGSPGASPKAYIQAALHADEHPGVMAAIHLIDQLSALDDSGKIQGEIIVIPTVNPFGLSQIFHHTHLGRYHQPTGQNYNRGWPNLTVGLEEAVQSGLCNDPKTNIKIIRKAIGQRIAHLPETSAMDKWKKTLLNLSYDADIVLDLHCDDPSLVHLFIMPQLIPHWEDLAAWIGAHATLMAEDSGGGSFDEVFPTPWVYLQRKFPNHPIPIATGSATVELRGRSDVSDAQGEKDAGHIVGFLHGRGFVSGVPNKAPRLIKKPSQLTAMAYVRMERTGLVSYRVKVGDEVSSGQHIADLISLDSAPYERVPIASPIDGQILSTNSQKYVRPGNSIAKVVGQKTLSNKGPYLLED